MKIVRYCLYLAWNSIPWDTTITDIFIPVDEAKRGSRYPVLSFDVTRFSTVSKKTKNDVVVLSEMEETLLTLLYKQSRYGMEFVAAIKKASRGRRDIGFGSLYPTLTRMERKNLVSWRWGDEQTGPRRKYYDITPYGRSVLQETWGFREALKEDDSINVDAEALNEAELQNEESEAIAPIKSGK